MLPEPTPGLILRVALAPDLEAKASWKTLSKMLNLDALDVAGCDLLPLLGHRLSGWGIKDPRLPRLLGTLRRTWYANHQRLSALADQLRADNTRPPKVLTGRTASVAHFFPTAGLQQIDRVEIHQDWHSPTQETAIQGVPVRVPMAAEHLVDMLLRSWWPDAAYAARAPGMDWEAFVRACVGNRRRKELYRRLLVLDDLTGRGLVPAPVMARLARPRMAWARVGPRVQQGISPINRR